MKDSREGFGAANDDGTSSRESADGQCSHVVSRMNSRSQTHGSGWTVSHWLIGTPAKDAPSEVYEVNPRAKHPLHPADLKVGKTGCRVSSLRASGKGWWKMQSVVSTICAR